MFSNNCININNLILLLFKILPNYLSNSIFQNYFTPEYIIIIIYSLLGKQENK